MTASQLTLGQAIDQVLGALTPLDDAARRTALAAVCMQLDIPLSDSPPKSGGAAPSSTSAAQHAEKKLAGSLQAANPSSSSESIEKQIDIRTFKEQKKPSSARQMACLVGFYLQELAPTDERKETFNAHDLEKYFKQAKFKLPGRINQILADAKSAGYFDSPSRGEYKLNAVGYNLVAHNLPSDTE
ncbi:hypothetical protein [Luteimonas sp. R10]|uniref:hypothetical protein n=1 Tax=Luteimonas sp. R10 TaxID=3108176 RepID=UPI0030873A61|nr:hypothetical protein U3649_06085 [Luteimonas sp. R10]